MTIPDLIPFEHSKDAVKNNVTIIPAWATNYVAVVNEPKVIGFKSEKVNKHQFTVYIDFVPKK